MYVSKKKTDDFPADTSKMLKKNMIGSLYLFLFGFSLEIPCPYQLFPNNEFNTS